MALLTWDAVGSRYYETGVDRGVLYIPDAGGSYTNGVAWNGLISVTEKPTGAEANPMYADNIKYLNLYSVEQFGATIEAYTYPDEWNQFDGLISMATHPGMYVGQQARKSFGLSYRTKLGNDTTGDDYGYKLHLMYGAVASPTERGYTTVNETPEPITFSWEITTTAVTVSTVGTQAFRPVSLITIDSSKANATALTNITNSLWGVSGNPTLPSPDSVIGSMATSPTATKVVPAIPTSFSATGGAITIPSTPAGVVYKSAATGATLTGTTTIGTGAGTWGIYAVPLSNAYYFDTAAASYWSFTRTS